MLKRVLLTLLGALFVCVQPSFAAPGRLISATPIVPDAPNSRGWRITYESQDSNARPIQVAGIVYVPEGRAPAGGWPVIAWAHGSWGLGDNCTLALDPAVWTQSPFLRTLLARGYAVAATDYAGFSTGGLNPYLVGDVTGYAVIDNVRAALQIRGAGTGRNFAVWGESQGGHAAIWTGQVWRGYAPGLNLVGIAAAAPPTDLAANLGGKTDPTIRAFLTAYTGASWEKYYGADLRTFTGPVGADLIRRIAKNCVSLKGFKFSTQIGILRLRGFLKGVDLPTVDPWRDLIARNSVSRAPTSAPLLIAQGGKDVVVSPDVTRTYARELCRQGQKLRFIWKPSMQHQDSAKETASETITWIGDRFAGRPLPNDCGKV